MDHSKVNYSSLSPVSFLKRSAELYPFRKAIVYGTRSQTWLEIYKRCCRLAAALVNWGIRPGEVVAILCPNTPPMIEAHFAIPMAGAILNTINTRLDVESVAYILDHSESRVLFVDQEYSDLATAVLALLPKASHPVVIGIQDCHAQRGQMLGDFEYESFLSLSPITVQLPALEDEQETIALNYTSGTTGRPKGVLYHHRGAYLNAIDNVISWAVPRGVVYLWTLPMFHCNGWCFPWTVTAVGGTHVCLRYISAETILNALEEHSITHLCGASVVMGMITEAGASPFRNKISFGTAGSSPPVSVLMEMERLGFEVTQFYGLTETYGPVVSCEWHAKWNQLSREERANLKAKQGVGCLLQDQVIIANPITLAPVPQDSKTLGEVLIRGNLLMKGYLRDEAATAKAFAGGWFHTGDLGVWGDDRYIEIKDRLKDIIISGGENISTIEIENALYMHSSVSEAAVVAQEDKKWGETPCAFVQVKEGHRISETEILDFCRTIMAHYKVPRRVIFGALPKTSTGKVQKTILRARANAE